MKYNNLQLCNSKEFRRVTGIKPKTFRKMVIILTVAEKIKKSKGGRPSKLSMEQKLLMALEYLREYRTYLAIGTSFGIAESNTFYAVRWVEDTLIKCGEFNLPGKRELLKPEINHDLILIDATESPIQRPKKTNANITQEKKVTIP